MPGNTDVNPVHLEARLKSSSTKSFKHMNKAHEISEWTFLIEYVWTNLNLISSSDLIICVVVSNKIQNKFIIHVLNSYT